MILVFSENTSTRLIYILNFCFKSKGISFTLTNDEQVFINSKKIKLNYSNKKNSSDYSIIPEGLLFETNMRLSVDVKFVNNNWLINQNTDEFSLIFFFLSCYEEYYISERDEHERSLGKNSTAFKYNRLAIPNCDVIVKQLWERLLLDYNPVQANFSSLFTFDIDSAWAVKNKSKLRTIGGDVKAIIQKQSISTRKKIRNNILNDPFDTFDYIKKLSVNNQVICFFLLGDWSKFDKNIKWNNIALQNLILDLKTKIEIGIHPSYQSYLNLAITKKECDRLASITSQPTLNSRQHFLKLKLPESYEILSKLNIEKDYSMGFSDQYGFRSGTSFSYPFFNLNLNCETELIIFPITYMDSTLHKYLKLSPAESISVINSLKKQVKYVGGTFIPLWHNETISDLNEWKNWLEVFESNLKKL